MWEGPKARGGAAVNHNRVLSSNVENSLQKKTRFYSGIKRNNFYTMKKKIIQMSNS